jgi:hypothetical protein
VPTDRRSASEVADGILDLLARHPRPQREGGSG